MDIPLPCFSHTLTMTLTLFPFPFASQAQCSTLSLPVILSSPVGVTLASFSGQGPSIFCNSLSPGTGCGTPPRPTLEALPRRSTSGCGCTR